MVSGLPLTPTYDIQIELVMILMVARCNTVVLANHSEAAGEYDPTLGGYGQTLL